jgi:hypothetical protein
MKAPGDRWMKHFPQLTQGVLKIRDFTPNAFNLPKKKVEGKMQYKLVLV